MMGGSVVAEGACRVAVEMEVESRTWHRLREQRRVVAMVVAFPTWHKRVGQMLWQNCS